MIERRDAGPLGEELVVRDKGHLRGRDDRVVGDHQSERRAHRHLPLLRARAPLPWCPSTCTGSPRSCSWRWRCPNPGRQAIDRVLLAHSWIINRVLLDDRYRAPLEYLCTRDRRRRARAARDGQERRRSAHGGRAAEDRCTGTGGRGRGARRRSRAPSARAQQGRRREHRGRGREGVGVGDRQWRRRGPRVGPDHRGHEPRAVRTGGPRGKGHAHAPRRRDGRAHRRAARRTRRRMPSTRTG